jgi:4-hydroxybenzoate polyprenyltransferase
VNTAGYTVSYNAQTLVRPELSRRLKAHLSLARISNSPTVTSNVLAGSALADTLGFGLNTLWIAASMVLLYTAGMYLNDLLDYDIDLRERPERPIPSGVVSKAEALAVTVLLFAAGLGLLALVSLTALLGGAVLVALIVAYDLWHKTNPLSPLLMASTRMLVYLTAALSLSAQPLSAQLSSTLIGWTLLLGLYIVGLTYIAKTERRTDLARYWPAALLVLPALYFIVVGIPGSSALIGTLLLVGFLAWVAYSLSFLYSPARRNVGRTVGSLIAGVSLLDALVLVSRGVPTIFVLLALTAFALTLFWQRFIKGT